MVKINLDHIINGATFLVNLNGFDSDVTLALSLQVKGVAVDSAEFYDHNDNAVASVYVGAFGARTVTCANWSVEPGDVITVVATNHDGKTYKDTANVISEVV